MTPKDHRQLKIIALFLLFQNQLNLIFFGKSSHPQFHLVLIWKFRSSSTNPGNDLDARNKSYGESDRVDKCRMFSSEVKTRIGFSTSFPDDELLYSLEYK